MCVPINRIRARFVIIISFYLFKFQLAFIIFMMTMNNHSLPASNCF